MKRIVWLVLMAASIVFVLIDISCNNPEKKNENEFYYYPKANVYFNVLKKTYIYSLNGGKSWGSIADSLGEAPVTLGEKVVLYSETDSVWKENNTHRNLYNGVLYNVAHEDSGAAIVATNAEVSAREKVHKKHKSTVVTEDKNTTNKRPIKRFFDRLFGRRKKAEKQE